MKEIVKRLDNICVESISKNINRYKRTPRSNWHIRYGNNFGERLIYACLANSFDDGVNESAYSFILNNFFVRKLELFPYLYENIKYFDFLNGLFVENIEIRLAEVIYIQKVDKHFQLTTNKLKLLIDNNYHVKESKLFLSNIYVEKELEIFTAVGTENNSEDDFENILLNLLENTSLNVEYIQISFREPSEDFLRKAFVILLKRKKLKKFDFINDNEKFYIENFLLHLIFSEFISQRDNLDFKDNPLSPYFTNFEEFQNSLLIFNSIENLHISFEKFNGKITDVFIFFSTWNLNNLSHLDLTAFYWDLLSTEFQEFIDKCHNLNYFKLTIKDKDEFDDYSSLYLMKKIFSMSSLKVLDFRHVYLDEEAVESFQPLQNTLTSLTILSSYHTFDEIENLPEVLRKFNKLEKFCLGYLEFENEIIPKIFHSLQSSSKTLQKVFVGCGFSGTQLQDCSSLFRFLEECGKLTEIELNFRIDSDLIPDLLLKFAKFQNILEKIDIGNFCEKRNQREMFEFLSGCTKLEIVLGENLPKNINWRNTLIESLENSLYSLRYIEDFNENELSGFPLVLSNISEFDPNFTHRHRTYLIDYCENEFLAFY